MTTTPHLMTRGDYRELTLTCTKADGTPQSLTGATILFSASRSPVDDPPLISKSTTESTITVLPAPNSHQAVAALLPADTSGLPHYVVTLVYDWQVTLLNTNRPVTVESGTIQVHPDVSR